MHPPAKGSSASTHLDALRGLAALLVAVGHARLMLVLNTDQLPAVPLWGKAFYFVTNLGSSAVMIFFVLSGFFIGSSVIQNIRDQKWDWRFYATARLSRLYTVLVPALIIGACMDIAGAHFLSTSIVYSTPHYGVMLPDNILDNVTPFIASGNLLFLQNIFVPTLGSNHPLWSLANEFWYYAMFPVLVLGLYQHSKIHTRVLCAVLIILMLLIVTPAICGLFMVWLMGAAITFVPKIRIRLWHIGIILLVLIGWLAIQSLKIEESAYVTGGLAALLIYALAAQEDHPLSDLYRRMAAALSSFSYTLYLVHTPFIVFMSAFVLGAGPKMQPDIKGIGATIGVLLLICLYAAFMWFLFEKRTNYVRLWMEKSIIKAAR